MGPLGVVSSPVPTGPSMSMAIGVVTIPGPLSFNPAPVDSLGPVTPAPPNIAPPSAPPLGTEAMVLPGQTFGSLSGIPQGQVLVAGPVGAVSGSASLVWDPVRLSLTASSVVVPTSFTLPSVSPWQILFTGSGGIIGGSNLFSWDPINNALLVGPATAGVSTLYVTKTVNFGSNTMVTFADNGPRGSGAVLALKGSGSGFNSYDLLQCYNNSGNLTTRINSSGFIDTLAWIGTLSFNTLSTDINASVLSNATPNNIACQSDVNVGGSNILVRDNCNPVTGRLWIGMAASTNTPITSVITSNGSIYLGSSGQSQIASPAAPTLSLGSAGVLNGSYTYKYTYLTADGETSGGATSAMIFPSNQQVVITVANGPAGTIGKCIYRTKSGGSDGTQRWVGTIVDNTTTTFTDNRADLASQGGGFGGLVPSVNTTAGGIFTNSSIYSYGTGTSSISGGLNIGMQITVPTLNLTGAVGLVMTNQTTITGSSTATFTNCPHSGNPDGYLEFSINGATKCIPYFALS